VLLDRHLGEGTAVIGWASARIGALGAILPEGQTDAGADALAAFRPRDLLQIVEIGKSVKRFRVLGSAGQCLVRGRGTRQDRQRAGRECVSTGSKSWQRINIRRARAVARTASRHKRSQSG
jgi:hypothetical protein